MKLPDKKIQYIDLPNVSEAFVDSLGSIFFDGQSFRIELCVTRANKPKPPDPPTARRYPACRLALTPEAFINLYNQLTKITNALQQQGILQKIEKSIKTSTLH